MKTSKRGQLTEQACSEYLAGKGLRLIENNYRCRYGEIDLVMRQANTVVFVEVRYRRNDNYGGALASVDHRKQRRIMKTVQHYIRERNIVCPTRIDVVAMSSDAAGSYTFDWLTDAVRGD